MSPKRASCRLRECDVVPSRLEPRSQESSWENTARLSRLAASRSRLFLLQLALGLLGKVKMLLNDLGCVVRKFFHVGITAVFCFFLELGEVLFVILDHRIHVSFIRTP